MVSGKKKITIASEFSNKKKTSSNILRWIFFQLQICQWIRLSQQERNLQLSKEKHISFAPDLYRDPIC